jgi:hypothetical protein
MNNCFFKSIVVVLAFLLSVSSCTKSNEKINEDVNEKIINAIIKEVKPDLPVKFDERLAWVDLKAGHDELIYICEMRGVDQSKIDKETMPSKLKTELIPFLKTQKDMERVFKRNINLRMVFRNETGDELFGFVISREDLGC